MSVRRILGRYMRGDIDVLTMDDGFTSVVPEGSVPETARFVRVSGRDVDIAGIRSLGDVVEPLTGQQEVGPERTNVGMTMGDCFHGHQLSFYMWGQKGSMGDVPTDGKESDQTQIVMNPGDVLACITADRDAGLPYCFDHGGKRIDGLKLLSKTGVGQLRNYYTFCGVLSADRTKFTAHCIWNNMNDIPVGPPYDRRMAKFVGIDFAPTCDSLAVSDYPIMVRVDGRMPIVIDPCTYICCQKNT